MSLHTQGRVGGANEPPFPDSALLLPAFMKELAEKVYEIELARLLAFERAQAPDKTFGGVATAEVKRYGDAYLLFNDEQRKTKDARVLITEPVMGGGVGQEGGRES